MKRRRSLIIISLWKSVGKKSRRDRPALPLRYQITESLVDLILIHLPRPPTIRSNSTRFQRTTPTKSETTESNTPSPNSTGSTFVSIRKSMSPRSAPEHTYDHRHHESNKTNNGATKAAQEWPFPRFPSRSHRTVAPWPPHTETTR